MSSPSKLFSCVQATSILKSPVNNSTAKNHWSFSKDSRFKAQKFYCDSFYDIPDKKSQRKTGFGYGKKTDLQFNKNPQNVIPPSNTYNIKSFVDINKHNNKGFTPNYSRQDIAPVSYIDVQQRKVPGPGSYQQFKRVDTPSWTLHNRTKSELFPQNESTHKIVPGPGSHENKVVIDAKGKYYVSNHRNSKAKTFNPSHSRRFSKSTTDFPGPGNYKPRHDLPQDGNYVLSKNNSARKRVFLMGRRDSFVDSMQRRVQTPGPGSYRLPSDFGQYDQTSPRKQRYLQSKGTQRTKEQS